MRSKAALDASCGKNVHSDAFQMSNTMPIKTTVIAFIGNTVQVMTTCLKLDFLFFKLKR